MPASLGVIAALLLWRRHVSQQNEAGAALFHRETALSGRLVGHALPTLAKRCSNCHAARNSVPAGRPGSVDGSDLHPQSTDDAPTVARRAALGLRRGSLVHRVSHRRRSHPCVARGLCAQVRSIRRALRMTLVVPVRR